MSTMLSFFRTIDHPSRRAERNERDRLRQALAVTRWKSQLTPTLTKQQADTKARAVIRAEAAHMIRSICPPQGAVARSILQEWKS